LNSQPDVYTPSGITTTDAVLYGRSIISPFSQTSASIPNGFSTAKSKICSTFGNPTAVLLATPSTSLSESLNGRDLQSSLEFARGTLASFGTIPSSSEGLLDVPLGASSTLPTPSQPSGSLTNFPEPSLAVLSSIPPNIPDIISSAPLPVLPTMISVSVPLSQSTGGSTNAQGVEVQKESSASIIFWFPGFGESEPSSSTTSLSSSTTSLSAQDDFLEAGSSTGKKTEVHIHAIGVFPEPTTTLPAQEEFLRAGSSTGKKTRIHVHAIGVFPEPTTTLPAQDDFLKTGSSTGKKTKAHIHSI
jgi:hypothetical protein